MAVLLSDDYGNTPLTIFVNFGINAGSYLVQRWKYVTVRFLISLSFLYLHKNVSFLRTLFNLTEEVGKNPIYKLVFQRPRQYNRRNASTESQVRARLWVSLGGGGLSRDKELCYLSSEVHSSVHRKTIILIGQRECT